MRYGISCILKELTVEDLENVVLAVCQLPGYGNAVLGCVKGVGQNQLAGLYLGVKERASGLVCLGGAGQNLTNGNYYVKGYNRAGGSLACGTVDGVVQGLRLENNVYVNVVCGHLKAVVGYGDGLLICSYNGNGYVKASGSIYLDLNGLANLCVCGNLCNTVGNDLVGDLGVGGLNGQLCAGSVLCDKVSKVICLPCANEAGLSGNVGNDQGCVVVGIEAKGLENRAVLLEELHGVSDAIPLCGYVDRLSAHESIVKADPLVGGSIAVGVLCLYSSLGQVTKLILLIEEVGIGGVQIAGNVVVNVALTRLNGNGNLDCAIGHLNGCTKGQCCVVVGSGNQSIVIHVGGEHGVKYKGCTCGEVQILCNVSLQGTKHRVGIVLVSGYEVQGQLILVGDYVIREVRSLEGNVLIGVGVQALQVLTYAVGIQNVNAGSVCIGGVGVADSLVVRQGDDHLTCKVLVELCAVQQEVELEERSILILCIYRTSGRCGSLCIGSEIKAYVSGGASEEVSQNGIVQLQELEGVCANLYAEGNVVVTVCKGQQVCAVKVQVEALGELLADGQCEGIVGAVNGKLNLIVYVLDVQEVVGHCVCDQSGVLGEHGSGETNSSVAGSLAGSHVVEVPCNDVAVVQILVVLGENECGKLNLRLDCGDLLGIVGKGVTGGKSDGSQVVTVLVYKVYVDTGAACVDHHVSCGHGGNGIAVLVGPLVNQNTVYVGVGKYGEVSAYGQEYLEQHLAVLLIHVGCAVDVGHLQGEIKGYGNRSNRQTGGEKLDGICNALNLVNLSRAAQSLIQDLLCVDRKGLAGLKSAVAVVQRHDARVQYGVGKQIQLINKVVSCCENGLELLYGNVGCDIVDLVDALILLKDGDGIVAGLVKDCGVDLLDRGNAGALLKYEVVELIQLNSTQILAGALCYQSNCLVNVCVGKNLVVNGIQINRIQSVYDITNVQVACKSNNLVAVEIYQIQNLCLGGVIQLIKVNKLVVYLCQRCGSGNLEAYRAVLVANVDILLQELGHLAGSCLQLGKVTVYNELNLEVLGLLGLGSVNGVLEANAGGEELAILSGGDLIQGGDHSCQSLYQSGRVNAEHAVCILGSNLGAVNNELVNVGKGLAEYKGENGSNVRLQINHLQKLHLLLVVNLLHDHSGVNDLQKLCCANLVNQNIHTNAGNQKTQIQIGIGNQTTDINVGNSLVVAAQQLYDSGIRVNQIVNLILVDVEIDLVAAHGSNLGLNGGNGNGQIYVLVYVNAGIVQKSLKINGYHTGLVIEKRVDTNLVNNLADNDVVRGIQIVGNGVTQKSLHLCRVAIVYGYVVGNHTRVNVIKLILVNQIRPSKLVRADQSVHLNGTLQIVQRQARIVKHKVNGIAQINCCENLVLVHVFEKQPLINVIYNLLGVDYRCKVIHVGKQSLNGLGIQRACDGVHVNVGQQLFNTNLLEERLKVKNLQEILLRNNLKQLFQGNNLGKRCQINLSSGNQSGDQLLGSILGLEDLKKSSGVQLQGNNGDVLVVYAAFQPRFRRKRADRHKCQDHQQRQEQGKNFAKYFHNKTSFFVSDSAALCDGKAWFGLTWTVKVAGFTDRKA